MGEHAGHERLYTNFVWNRHRWDGFELRDDDIIISTPPKCGTTWMQMQIALLLFRTPDLPASLATLSPWLDMNTRPLAEVVAQLDAQTHRRFIKTHLPLAAVPWDDRVTYVHVARDPRDVALSWDNHMANIDGERFFAVRSAAVGVEDLEGLGIDGPGTLPEDPEGRFWHWTEGDGVTDGPSGLEALLHHSATFWVRRDSANIHLFHFSDLRRDLAGQMGRLAEALGVEPPTHELVVAAEFEQMKARADELVPNSDTPYWNDPRRFFDKARSGDWRALIGEAGLARYEAAVAAAMPDTELAAWVHTGWLG